MNPAQLSVLIDQHNAHQDPKYRAREETAQQYDDPSALFALAGMPRRG